MSWHWETTLMPRLKDGQLPKHTRHSSGQGRVVLSGETHYTGAWGPLEEPCAECKARYDELIGKWFVAGKRPLGLNEKGDTIGGLSRKYQAYGVARFRKRGEMTTHARRILRVCNMVRMVHERTLVTEFRPKDFKGLRAAWVATRSRKTVNSYAEVVVDMIRWGVAEDLVHPDILARLRAVDPLTKFDVGKPDPPRKLSVSPEELAWAVERIPKPACDILRLLDATGMRPGEACAMNLRDLDRSGECWVYRVTADYNKTEHHDRPRVVFLGPKAQSILEPYVERAERSSHGWIFTPRFGRRAGKEPYLPFALAEHLRDTLREHGKPVWTANALRHGAATRIRKAEGLEATRAVLGHSSPQTTLVYIDPEAHTADERESARRTALAMG